MNENEITCVEKVSGLPSLKRPPLVYFTKNILPRKHLTGTQNNATI